MPQSSRIAFSSQRQEHAGNELVAKAPAGVTDLMGGHVQLSIDTALAASV